MQTNLLLIEDDPISLEIIRALCERRGFAVDAVGDGFGGLRLLREKTYAVALVDYHLPEMDGFALARLMRDLSGTELPLIGITADQKGLAARRGADALFDAILSKPVTEDVLARALETGVRTRLPGITGEKAQAIDAPIHPACDAATALWRRFGLGGRPSVLACPRPMQAAREALSHAFILVEAPADAEAILLLDLDGLPLAEEARMRASRPLPVVALMDSLRQHVGGVFHVDDLASWARVATLLRPRALRMAPEPAAPGVPPALDGARPQAERVGASSLVMALHEAGRAQGRTRSQGDGHAHDALPERESLSARADRLLLGIGSGRVGLAKGVPTAEPSTGLVPDLLADIRTGLNHERYDELVSILGRERVLALMETLAAQCARSLEAGSHRARPEVLAEYAHQMVSSAGLLGFSDLSDACRQLEMTVRRGGDASASVAAVRSAYHRTTKVIASLRHAA